MAEIRTKLAETSLDDARRERVESFQAAWDAMVEAVAALSPEDQERFVRELTEAIDGGIRRRVAWLDAAVGSAGEDIASGPIPRRLAPSGSRA